MSLSKIQLSELSTIYGKLLTEKQKDALTMYCDLDCSLSEIADEIGISRQGVRDAIQNAEVSLVKMENALGIAELSRQMISALQQDNLNKLKSIAENFVSKE
ncbi:MAG: hypothetical protein NC350_01845 [Corallococcus sp.]|nr:hypothetical protein [Corallococcus sp.]